MRPINQIAAEIYEHWPKPHSSALPYLKAMRNLTSVSDPQGLGRAIVNHFLANAHMWHGPKADEIKAELEAILKGPRL